ncbi:MAG: intermembrane transport protein PqiB [Phycisphaerales bacterium]
MSDSSSQPSAQLPQAIVRPRGRWSWAWLLPVIALIFVAGLLWRSWSMRGVDVTISFDAGYGLRSGDTLRYRGIEVGEVRDIRLSPDLTGTIVDARLFPDAAHLARTGTQFWIVRPRIGPSGVSGLDTIVGPRYIAVQPSGSDTVRFDFDGLDEPPVIAQAEEGDLEIILQANQRGSLQAGGPVTYRGVQVGTVVAVGLRSDGSGVDARAHIQSPYVSLMTRKTRFWDSGGVTIRLDLSGVTVDIDSLAAATLGGVSLAVPPDGGPPVRTGHRFQLFREADEEWLKWNPAVLIGNELLPTGARLPHMERARLSWETSIVRRDKSRSAWVIPTERGIIAPLSLLETPDGARDRSLHLEIAGADVPRDAGLAFATNGMGMLEVRLAPSNSSATDVWKFADVRAAAEVEDVLVTAGSAMPMIPVSAARLLTRSGIWKVDEAMSFADEWNGAAVLSRVDGALLGILLVEDGVGRVALFPIDVVKRLQVE